MSNRNPNPNRDYVLKGVPEDSISSVAWSPKSNFVVASSWGFDIRCWQIQRNGNRVNGVAKSKKAHTAPLLCSTWSGDGTRVFFGTADNKVMSWNLGRDDVTQVAQHDAPVKSGMFAKKREREKDRHEYTNFEFFFFLIFDF
jgi:mRNA export factor